MYKLETVSTRSLQSTSHNAKLGKCLTPNVPSDRMRLQWLWLRTPLFARPEK